MLGRWRPAVSCGVWLAGCAPVTLDDGVRPNVDTTPLALDAEGPDGFSGADLAAHVGVRRYRTEAISASLGGDASLVSLGTIEIALVDGSLAAARVSEEDHAPWLRLDGVARLTSASGELAVQVPVALTARALVDDEIRWVATVDEGVEGERPAWMVEAVDVVDAACSAPLTVALDVAEALSAAELYFRVSAWASGRACDTSVRDHVALVPIEQ